MKTIKIGRSSSNDFVLDDISVSRQHAVLTVSDSNVITIRDLNSTAGTKVDGTPITGETVVTPHSVIKLGNTEVSINKILEATSPNHRIGSGRIGSDGPSNYNYYKIISSFKDRKSIGRDVSNDIRISAGDVSNCHAVMGRNNNGQVVIVDLGSRNGTFVNGQKISGPTVLSPNDTIRLASSTPLNWTTYYSNSIIVSNRKLTICVAAILLLVIGSLVTWRIMGTREWSPQEIYSHYKSAVVMIYNEYTYSIKLNGHSPSEYTKTLEVLDNLIIDSDGDPVPGVAGGTGTGFFISSDGRIMTNKHVLFPTGNEKKHADKIKKAVESYLYAMARQTGNSQYIQLASDIEVEYVSTWLGVAMNDTHVSTKSDFLPAVAVKGSQDDEVDVAILQLKNKMTPDNATIVDIINYSEPKNRQIGNKVFTLGFPKSFILGNTDVGLEANNQSGEITQDRGENTYGHNITIHQGASGSPVFDHYGKFAGIIVSGYLGLSQGYNQAVQPDKASSFVK